MLIIYVFPFKVRVERDQLQNERNRLILQKDKLETLCRELQKQNKIIQVGILFIVFFLVNHFY